MQKVLTEMNVQLANVISDISGLTGLADKGMKYYEEKYREHEIRSIQKKAKDLGLVVTLSPAA